MRRLILAFFSLVLAASVLIVAPAEALAPDVPTGVNAVANGTSAINVAWTPPAAGDAPTSYSVTISPDPNAVSPLTIPFGTNSASFSSLSPGTLYTVGVSAVNIDGSSAEVTAQATTAVGLPGTPVISVGVVTSTSVAVSWTSVANGGTNTYAATISPAHGTGSIGPGSGATSATFTGLTPGVLYTVTVTATNSAGSTPNTAQATTGVGLPGTPDISFVASTQTSISVSWSATANAGTNTYQASISPNDGGGAGAVAAGSSSTSTTFTGLTQGKEYTVSVTATNSAGSTGNSEAFSTAALPAPNAPTSVSAGNDLDDLTVTWGLSGGGAVDEYIITLSNGGGSQTVGPAIRTVTFLDLASGNYTATVKAKNASGEASSTSGSVTIPGVPGAPTGVSVSLRGIDQLTVSWIAPAVNGGSAITGFELSISPGVGQAIPDAAAGDSSYVIGGLVPGTTYRVTVKAANAIGAGTGTTSNALFVPTTPGAATNVTVVQAPMFTGTASVSWEAPADTGGSAVVEDRVTVNGVAKSVVPSDTSVTFSGVAVGEHTATVQTVTIKAGPLATSPPFEVRAFAPFASEADFIKQMYQDFLKRPAEGAGLAYWQSITANDGSNVEAIVSGFMDSPEFSPRRRVARIFLAYFNRQPDKAGFDYWTQQLATDQATLQAVSNSFAASAEFQQTYGSLTNAQFVVLVYNNVLNRNPPDLAGFVYWLDLLDRKVVNRGEMMTQFSESAEFVAKSRPAVDVTVTYDGLLQREADTAGFKFWRDLIRNDADSLNTLIRAFYESDEYALRTDG